MGSRVARFKDLKDLPDGTFGLEVDLVPNGLVGITGTLIGGTD